MKASTAVAIRDKTEIAASIGITPTMIAGGALFLLFSGLFYWLYSKVSGLESQNIAIGKKLDEMDTGLRQLASVLEQFIPQPHRKRQKITRRPAPVQETQEESETDDAVIAELAAVQQQRLKKAPSAEEQPVETVPTETNVETPAPSADKTD